MEDIWGLFMSIFLAVIMCCSICICIEICEINDRITSNCITVEDKVYCERGEQ